MAALRLPHICSTGVAPTSAATTTMQASAIFTSNDVIINLRVIIAGLLVNRLNSNKPDFIN